jgi:hypothetical protein
LAAGSPVPPLQSITGIDNEANTARFPLRIMLSLLHAMLFQSVFFDALSQDGVRLHVATLVVREYVTAKHSAPIPSLTIGFRLG